MRGCGVVGVGVLFGHRLNHEAECTFRFLTDSSIVPEDESGNEVRISFHYVPLDVVAPQ